MKERFAALVERLRPHREAALEVAVGAALCLVLLVVGVVGWRGGSEQARSADELRALLAATEGWSERFVDASQEERAEWIRAQEAVRELEFPADDRIALLELVSSRASAVGIPNPRVRFHELVEGYSWRHMTGWTLEEGEQGLTVDFVADYWSLVAFLGALPPIVELRRMELTGGESTVRAEIVLSVYESMTPPPAQHDGRPRSLTAGNWTALEPYLTPTAREASAADGLTALPDVERDPFLAPLRRVAPPPARPPAPLETVVLWRVSAIMITDSRRAAIIDGRVVEAGDTLSGGGRVVAIDRGRVVVHDRDGRVRNLALHRGSDS